MAKGKWLNVPEKDALSWLGEYIMASLVVDSYHSKKGAPKQLRVKKILTKERKDGGCDLTIDYDTKW